MMISDTQVPRDIVRGSCLLLFGFVALLVLSLMSPIPHQIYATDQECVDLRIDDMESKCIDFLDNTGNIIPGASYYKCDDTVSCDNPNTQRCCIKPNNGSYGGECLNPVDSRSELGLGGVGGSQFMGMQQNNCDIDPDALSPEGREVYIIPPQVEHGVRSEQSLSEWYHQFPQGAEGWLDSYKEPEHGVSIKDLPVLEEVIQVRNHPLAQDWHSFGLIWYYQVDPATLERRYFVRPSTPTHLPAIPTFENALYINGWKVSSILYGDRHPIDPRASLDNPIDKVGCRVGNAFKRVGNAILSPMIRWTTSAEQMPDISFLCGKGTPQFENPSQIGFDPNGEITGFTQSGCHCVDANSGPSVAAVLLCTRFVAGMSDVYAPWRLLIPVPANGASGGRFFPLIFGGTQSPDTLDQFTKGVSDDIQGFFGSNHEVTEWITHILSTQYLWGSPEFMARFFGQESNPGANTIINDPIKLNAFKNNKFVKQYISCLSCAKWGGFPTAIGCMPMGSVDRFLGEGVLGIGITFAGAFSVLCIIFGAIQFQLSGGESAKVQKAQKLITQCILGLLIILFSVFLLRLVGVNLLRIYGLG